MKNNILRFTKNIFLYNNFVSYSESTYGHLDSWLNMEILNALALDEWESYGCPVEWKEWEDKYQEKANVLVEKFLLDSGLEYREKLGIFNHRM